MRRIKLWVGTGFAGCDYEDTIEVDDNVTNSEIDEEARMFLFNNISYG